MLRHAEMLFVAMSTMVDVIGSKTDYPIDNMQSILLAYKEGRDKQLAAQGISDAEGLKYTIAATEALISWLDEKADFGMWLTEMGWSGQ